jgi:hypothetical protein
MDNFTAEQFTPTQWDDAQTKANFGCKFIKFVASDFDPRRFSQAFYRRLSLTFGHIAHYNRQGFYATFFTTTEDKVRFLRMTLNHPCYGDHSYTYADVERAIQGWLRQSGILAKYEERLADERETGERTELARLKAKYEMKSVANGSTKHD